MTKLIIEPGEYSCTWNIDGESHPGSVEFRAHARTQGDVFDLPTTNDPTESQPGYWSPFRRTFPYLSGTLRGGQTFVLIDAKTDYWYKNRARVVGEVAICGVGIDSANEPPIYRSIQFQVGGLAELAGTGPLSIKIPHDSSPKVFEVAWRQEADRVWQSGSDEVRLGFHVKYSPAEVYSFSITTSPFVKIVGSPRTIEQWRKDYVDTVRSLASVATGANQPVTWMIVGETITQQIQGSKTRTWEAKAQVFAPDIAQTPYNAERNDQDQQNLINLSSEHSSLPLMISQWNAISEKHATFLELFQHILGEGVTLRTALLALAPGLESFHGEKFGHGQTTIEDHKAQLKRVFGNLADDGVSNEDRKWLKRWINSRGGYSLAERLRQLYGSLSSELREVIDPKIKPIPELLADIHESANDVWDSVARLRNDLAHGGISRRPEQIKSGAHLCDTLATALVLQELGVPHSRLIEAIKGATWRVV